MIREQPYYLLVGCVRPNDPKQYRLQPSLVAVSACQRSTDDAFSRVCLDDAFEEVHIYSWHPVHGLRYCTGKTSVGVHYSGLIYGPSDCYLALAVLSQALYPILQRDLRSWIDSRPVGEPWDGSSRGELVWLHDAYDGVDFRDAVNGMDRRHGQARIAGADPLGHDEPDPAA